MSPCIIVGKSLCNITFHSSKIAGPVVDGMVFFRRNNVKYQSIVSNLKRKSFAKIKLCMRYHKSEYLHAIFHILKYYQDQKI